MKNDLVVGQFTSEKGHGTTKYCRQILGSMTQHEFSDRFGIPYRTVTNWDSRKCMPQYVEAMVEEIYQRENDYADLLERYKETVKRIEALVKKA